MHDISSLLTEEFYEFVEKHSAADPTMLRLRHHANSSPWIQLAITHIECLQKCKGKLHALRPEIMVSPLSVEQSTSEKVARLHGNICKRIAPEAKSVLDMTCGMGVDLHAVTDALPDCDATGVELNGELAQATSYNFRNDRRLNILNADSVQWLQEYSGARFDIIFIDPARRSQSGGRVYNMHDCSPDVIELMPLLAARCHHAVIKLSPMLDISQTLRDLPLTCELHVVDEGGECRELLAVLDFEKEPAEPHIFIHSDKGDDLCFTLQEERSSAATYGEPVEGSFLFEPSPAAMKAQPFSILASRYGLTKIAPNTHLYHHSSPNMKLPGKWYRIEHVHEFKSSTVKEIGKHIGRADVAVRNFPLKAEELQKKLKIKSGGEWRIIGTETINGAERKRILLQLKK